MKVALVYTPTEIHPDVVDWLTDGWKGKPEDVISFLKHLAVLRQGVALKAESIIVVEQGATLAPDFEKKVAALIMKIPADYTTCLLSHYVTSWDGITYVENSDKLLCNPTDKVLGSFAYWIRTSHAEHLLAMYDQPLRNIPNFKLSPEKISRFGRVCMLVKPLAARLDQKEFRKYYSNYGFCDPE